MDAEFAAMQQRVKERQAQILATFPQIDAALQTLGQKIQLAHERQAKAGQQ